MPRELKIGQKIMLRGIEWEVVGGKHPYYRLTHKCQRWTLTPENGRVKIHVRTVRLNSHRQIEEGEIA